MSKSTYIKFRKRILECLIVIAFLIVMICAWKNRPDAYVDQFRDVRSANYQLVCDDENYCYRIYKNGKPLGGMVDYGDPIVVRDDHDGSVTLYTKYEDFQAYQPIPMDEELKEDIIRAMGKTAYFEEPFTHFHIIENIDLNLTYITKDSIYDDEHVLLADEKDIEKYQSLAQSYGKYFVPADIGDMIDFGYIYADLEVKGRAGRTERGFWYIQPATIAYLDFTDTEKGWTLTLTYDEFNRFKDWIEEGNLQKSFPRENFQDWQPIFDELAIAYDIPYEPQEARCKAAMDSLIADWGSYPAENMTEKAASEHLRNRMKEFDENGNRMNIFGVSGMYATGQDAMEAHVIIEVPEEDRQAMFDYEKNRLIETDGLSRDDSDRAEIYRKYQLSEKVENRRKGSWTLGQYDRMYAAVLLSELKKADRGWEYGDPVDAGALSDVTREMAEARITSDGKDLHIEISPEIQDMLKEYQLQNNEWML